MTGRVGATQRAILDFVKERGPHCSIGAATKVGRTSLAGYELEEVERSLRRLVERGLVIEVKRGFYSMPDAAAPTPAAEGESRAYVSSNGAENQAFQEQRARDIASMEKGNG